MRRTDVATSTDRRSPTRAPLLVLAVLSAVAFACGGSGGGSASGIDDGGDGGSASSASSAQLAGTWSCAFTEEGLGTNPMQGEVVETSVAGTQLYVSATYPWDLTDWFCDALTISGASASVAAPFTCPTGEPADPRVRVSTGSISTSADGQTLTVTERGAFGTGPHAMLTGTCSLTAAATPSGSSGSSGGSGGSSGSSSRSTPQCTADSQCGDCAMCDQGTCYVCAYGSEGICDCL